MRHAEQVREANRKWFQENRHKYAIYRKNHAMRHPEASLERQRKTRAKHKAQRDGYTVYQFFDSDGEVIYVGMTCDWLQRQKQHRIKPWFPEVATIALDKYEELAKARASESQLLRQHRPRYCLRLY